MKEYSKYVGKDFKIGDQDCYGLIRDFYLEEYGMTLTNYARPDLFWHDDNLSLYENNIRAEGFKRIDFEDVRSLKTGDIILAAIGSVNPCHALIYLGQGKVLHHFVNRRSCIETYGGTWRNSTMSAYRHPKVTELEPKMQTMEITEDDRIKAFIEARARRSGESRSSDQKRD